MTNDFIHCCIFCWGSTMDDCFPLKRYPKTGDSGTAAFLTRCLGRFLVKLLSKKQWPADVIDIYIYSNFWIWRKAKHTEKKHLKSGICFWMFMSCLYFRKDLHRGKLKSVKDGHAFEENLAFVEVNNGTMELRAIFNCESCVAETEGLGVSMWVFRLG